MSENSPEIKSVISNPAKILLAYMRATNKWDSRELSAEFDIPLRTIQRWKMECATSASDAISGVPSVNEQNATRAIDAMDGAPLAPQAPDLALARNVQSRGADSINNITNTTPGESRASANEADELARQAYLAGVAIKGGKVAKSARAEQRTKGELDGSRGITFADGELSVDPETAAKILAKFPGIDVQAACDKAAPEVARMNYPTRDDAAAVIGKWARIELQNASKGQSKTADVLPFKVTTAMWVKPREETAYAG